MSYLTKKPTPDKNEKGIYVITEKYCCDLSEYSGHYSIPKFINGLHLHFKGFQKIENLASFVNLQVLYLENNCISKIEGLTSLSQLCCLYLMNNFICELTGLENNKNLVLLNVSHNKIKVVSNISHLTKLQTLTLDNNLIENPNHISEISSLSSLSVFGLNDNLIDEPVLANQFCLIDILKSIPTLRVFYFKGNEIIRKIPNYRKLFIKELENLTYLDEKPVDECERLATEAFWKGGLAEERRVRKEYRIKKDFGHRVREIEKDNPSESIEERKRKSLESLKNEFLYKKEEMKKRKKRLMKEYEEANERGDKKEKAQKLRELQSVDNQILENEIFKCEEENDKSGIVVRRGEHITKMKELKKDDLSNKDEVENEQIDLNEEYDKSNIFIFEDWMNPVFEFYLVNYMWNFNDAVNCFQYEYKDKVRNINLLTERDLRIRWSHIESEYLKKIEENDWNVLEERGVINLNEKDEFDNKIKVITRKERERENEEVGVRLCIKEEVEDTSEIEMRNIKPTQISDDICYKGISNMNFEELD